MAKFHRKDFEVTAERVREDTVVQTARGDRVAIFGDWILRDLSGNKWTMSDIVFRAMYDPMDEEARAMMQEKR